MGCYTSNKCESRMCGVHKTIKITTLVAFGEYKGLRTITHVININFIEMFFLFVSHSLFPFFPSYCSQQGTVSGREQKKHISMVSQAASQQEPAETETACTAFGVFFTLPLLRGDPRYGGWFFFLLHYIHTRIWEFRFIASFYVP